MGESEMSRSMEQVWWLVFRWRHPLILVDPVCDSISRIKGAVLGDKIDPFRDIVPISLPFISTVDLIEEKIA